MGLWIERFLFRQDKYFPIRLSPLFGGLSTLGHGCLQRTWLIGLEMVVWIGKIGFEEDRVRYILIRVDQNKLNNRVSREINH